MWCSDFDFCFMDTYRHILISCHYSDVIMGAMASQIIGVSIVCSTVCSGADQRKHQSSASLAFVRGIHRWPVDSPHKGPVTRKMFPFDDVSWLLSIVMEGNLCKQSTNCTILWSYSVHPNIHAVVTLVMFAPIYMSGFLPLQLVLSGTTEIVCISLWLLNYI